MQFANRGTRPGVPWIVDMRWIIKDASYVIQIVTMVEYYDNRKLFLFLVKRVGHLCGISFIL